MNTEPRPPVRTSRRTRRTVGSVAVAVVAMMPIGACSSGADDPTTADADEPAVTTSPVVETSAAVTVAVSPTVPTRGLFGTPGEELEPGTYYVDAFDGTPTPRVHVTIGRGWTNWVDWGLFNEDVQAFVSFSRPDAVLAEACHPSEGYHPGPMTTLDGLVAALSEQRGWAEVTTPADRSIDGYSGKTFQRTSPADLSGCPREYASPPAEKVLYPQFPSWENGNPQDGFGWSYYDAGTTETLWVLDVDGTIIILNTRVGTSAPEAVHAELATYLDSIRIDRG